MRPVVVIPALNPDQRLVELVARLRVLGISEIVVVDDGSSAAFRPLFQWLKQEHGCIIRRHKQNLGKGAALKTGIRGVLNLGAAGVVTADADGQHSPEDILKISQALVESPNALVLGIRDLTSHDVPFKSRWGNRITSCVFRLSTGVPCPDTQTGLRGIPAGFAAECMQLPGNRYDYEMNLLTEAARQKLPMKMLPIRTIYLDGNHSSHFRAVRDSALIYWHLLKFGMSSLLSAAVDLGLFHLFTGWVVGMGHSGILAATVLARGASGGVNFALNKLWVFGGSGKVKEEAGRYLALFCGQMTASWLLVGLLSPLPLPLTLIKAFVDGGLFFASYRIQKNHVFRPRILQRECAQKS